MDVEGKNEELLLRQAQGLLDPAVITSEYLQPHDQEKR